MVNKERYIDILSEILNEHYDKIKQKSGRSKDREHYIDGYLMAARALDALDYEELRMVIDKIHFDAFGKTIEERRHSEVVESTPDEGDLDIPTYVRKGVALDKG